MCLENILHESLFEIRDININFLLNVILYDR